MERYISGTDSYGAGFVKHNTNAGYVDAEEHRQTPQVFQPIPFMLVKVHVLLPIYRALVTYIPIHKFCRMIIVLVMAI